MAISHKRRVEDATKARIKATAAIFGHAKEPHHTFGEIMEYAPAKLRERYQDIEARLRAYEADAVACGKAWRGKFGLLVWNR